MNYVDIEIPVNSIEANILANHLKQNGVECRINNSNSSGIYQTPSLINTQIMVPEKDLKRARVIADQFLKEQTK